MDLNPHTAEKRKIDSKILATEERIRRLHQRLEEYRSFDGKKVLEEIENLKIDIELIQEALGAHEVKKPAAPSKWTTWKYVAGGALSVGAVASGIGAVVGLAVGAEIAIATLIGAGAGTGAGAGGGFTFARKAAKTKKSTWNDQRSTLLANHKNFQKRIGDLEEHLRAHAAFDVAEVTKSTSALDLELANLKESQAQVSITYEAVRKAIAPYTDAIGAIDSELEVIKKKDRIGRTFSGSPFS